MKRVVMVLCLLLLATTAAAVTPPTIKLEKVEPPVAAIHGGSDTTIEIRDPAEELILLDAAKQPFLRMTKEGVFERNSKGEFALVRKENFFYLHDGHIGRAVVERKSLPYPWRIEGTYGGKPFVMEGTLIPAGTRADAGATTENKVGLVLAVLAFGLVAVGIVGVVLFVRNLFRA